MNKWLKIKNNYLYLDGKKKNKVEPIKCKHCENDAVYIIDLETKWSSRSFFYCKKHYAELKIISQRKENLDIEKNWEKPKFGRKK